MNGGHWKQQQLIDHIYGIGPADGHVDSCPECRERLAAMIARKQMITPEPDASYEFLAAQRRSIHRRLDEPRARNRRLAPAFAATLVVLAGILAMRETPRPAPPLATASDAQLFSDIYALEQTSEPRAAAPVQALFEEN